MRFFAKRAAPLRSFWCDVPLALLLALVLSGCESQVPPPPVPVKLYAGPELPESEISVIHRRSWYKHKWWWSYQSNTTYLQVMRVDGKLGEIDPGRLDPFHVLPGKHKVRVKTTGGEGMGRHGFMTSDTYGEIEFSTKAGRQYYVMSRRVYDVIYKRFGIFVDPRSAPQVIMRDLWIWVLEVETGAVVAGEKPPDD
jgi:hypothetical protein